jgi:hypothetical protein
MSRQVLSYLVEIHQRLPRFRSARRKPIAITFAIRQAAPSIRNLIPKGGSVPRQIEWPVSIDMVVGG